MNEDQLDPYPLSLCAEIYKLTLYLALFGRQCAMQVLIGDCEPLVWGKGGRGGRRWVPWTGGDFL